MIPEEPNEAWIKQFLGTPAIARNILVRHMVRTGFFGYSAEEIASDFHMVSYHSQMEAVHGYVVNCAGTPARIDPA